ncbi:hypothetical protein KOCBH_02636 [Klebsiella michiganensis]|nr:hypothetical protein KOCBH_02636 [Klebsiella michiganensis]
MAFCPCVGWRAKNRYSMLDLFVEYKALSLVSYGMMITDFYYGYTLGYTVNQSAAMYSYLRPVDINEQS